MVNYIRRIRGRGVMVLFRPKTKLGNLWITRRRRWNFEQSNVIECRRQERER